MEHRKRKGKAQIFSLNRGKLEPARAFLTKVQ
jgi:hypothetical protein